MCHLHKVINLSIAANNGRAHHGAIDGRVGTNLHVILNDDIANLREFLVHTFCVRFKAKSIATYDYTCVQDTVLPHNTIVIDFHARIKDSIIANTHIITYIRMRINLHTFTQLDILTDIRKGTNIGIFGYGNTLTYETRLLNTLFSRVHSFRYESKQLAHSSASILHADKGGLCLACKLDGIGHKYHTSTCLRQVRKVLGIAEESELSLFGCFDSAYIPNLAIGIASYLTAKKCGYLLSGKLHMMF